MTTATRNSSGRASGQSSSLYRYDDDAAERAVRFFGEYLTHVKGEMAGQSFALMDWQANQIIRPLFGWKRVSDDKRRYRRVYVEVPRKNGKSTLAAGVALYLLFADQEPGAEVYSAASDRDQAAIVFDVARTMVEEEPALKGRSQVFRRSITVPLTNSSYKVLSADAYTKHGLNAHGIIFDELHAQPNRELWDVLTTSTGARRQPVIFAITTAGYDRESICWELHDYACKVRDGIIHDDAFLSVIYSVPEDMDWSTDEAMEMANPGINHTVSYEYLESERQRALQVPGYTNTYRRLHLCQWTESVSRWLPMDAWNELSDEAPPSFDGRGCYGGIDLSATQDYSALSLVFPRDDGGYDVEWHFWIPEETLANRSNSERTWSSQGFVHVTDGNVVDYDVIRRDINELGERYNILEIAIDRWNATHITTQLMTDGFNMIQFGQGVGSMSAPAKELERLVLERKFHHYGHPVARWMAANVTVEQDAAGNIKPSKKKSGDRIDGIVSATMALGRASLRQGADAGIFAL